MYVSMFVSVVNRKPKAFVKVSGESVKCEGERVGNNDVNVNCVLECKQYISFSCWMNAGMTSRRAPGCPVLHRLCLCWIQKNVERAESREEDLRFA
jgi:hypothetical protein